MLRLRTVGVLMLMAVPCFAQQAAAPLPALIRVRDDVNWGAGPAAGNVAGMMQELR